MNEEKGKKWLVIGAIIVIVLLILSPMIISKSYSEIRYGKVKREMLTQLQNKYHQEFKIKSIEYTPQLGIYQAVGELKNNAKWTFAIRQGGQGGEIVDNYLVGVWYEDTSNYFQKDVSQVYSNNSPNLVVRPIESEKYFIGLNSQYTFDYMQNNMKEECKLYGTIFYFVNVTPENKEELMKNLYVLYQQIYSENYEKVNIEIIFRNPDVFKDPAAKKFARENGIKNPLENSNEFVQLYDSAYFSTFFSQYDELYMRLEFNEKSKELTYGEFKDIKSISSHKQ